VDKLLSFVAAEGRLMSMGEGFMKRSIHTCMARGLFILLMLACHFKTQGDTTVFKIMDDPEINAVLSRVRTEFLARHPYVTRLDAAILVANGDGTWRRCSYNPEAISYPASCVKLAYLASAMYWCRINNLPYNHLDADVRLMIVKSDNPATGRVVDAITGAPNYPAGVRDEAFNAWYEKRLFTENFLKARGLLENQTLMHKTYPSNSGESPNGAEKLAVDFRNGNRMQPKCAASLMLEIVKGAIEPGATEYMRALLRRERCGAGSEFGLGLPPGSIYENKYGQAYDTLEDIAYVKLPNGKEFILAAFSNGYVEPEKSNPSPYDVSLLGTFCEMLIEQLKLDEGCPPKIKMDNTDPRVKLEGEWSIAADPRKDYDMFGESYLYTTSDPSGSKSVTWNLNIPASGLYEVCVWYPQKKEGGFVLYTVNHAKGSDSIKLNQAKCGGRWYRLGDFEFKKGEGSVILTNMGLTRGDQIITADAVKATKWTLEKKK